MIVPVEEAVARTVSGPVFLALTIWREARGASVDAQVAVGYSIMNRVESPSWWGKSLDEVLGKKWQYSSMAAPGDPQLILFPRFGAFSWLTALAVARAVMAKTEPNPVPGADSYYDSSLDKIGKPPKWAATGKHVGDVASPGANTLRFYDLDNDYEKATTGHV